MLVWERYLKPGDLFIDVGANIGTYSVLGLGIGAEVIAMEPAPETLPYLRRNNDLNGSRIHIVPAAAGEHPGVATFTSGKNEQNHIDPTGTVTVEVTTLDQLIGQRTVAGLKLDVEGRELDALKGATEALREHRIRLLQVEWNDLADRGPIERLLRRFGYEIFQPTPTGDLVPFRPQGPGADVFAAVPPTLHEQVEPKRTDAGRRTRVSLFTAFSPVIGGGSVQLRSVIPELNDIDVTWYYLAPQLAPSDVGKWLGLPLSPVPFILDLCVRACRNAGSTSRIERLVEQMEGDFFWVVAHNEGVSVASALVAKGKRVHLSVHDDPAVVFSRSRKYRPFAPIVNMVFGRVFLGASSVDVIGSGMQDYYQQRFGRSSAILYRFSPDQADLAAVDQQSAGRRLRIGHIGQLYAPDPFRSFLTACQRYVQDRDWTLEVVTVGRSQHMATIQSEHPDIFEPHDDLDEQKAIEVLSSCNVLYAMYPDGNRFRHFRQTSVPMKLSTYVLAQRPLFAHAPGDSTLAGLVRRYGIGVACSSTEVSSLEVALSEVLGAAVTKEAFERARRGLMGQAQVDGLRAALRSLAVSPMVGRI